MRLVDPDGEQLGIKLLPEALAIARDLDLDLVEVAPGANPPVCRIMDFGKHKFDEAQRAKESKRKAVHVGIKEMKYRPKIGPGDFDTKTRQVAKFLEEGHKVKITIMFRGREVFHPELGQEDPRPDRRPDGGPRQVRVDPPPRRPEHGHGPRPGEAGEAGRVVQVGRIEGCGTGRTGGRGTAEHAESTAVPTAVPTQTATEGDVPAPEQVAAAAPEAPVVTEPAAAAAAPAGEQSPAAESNEGEG